MPTLNVTLPARLKAAIDQRIASGEYEGPGEYLVDLVRRDQQRRKHRSLEQLLLGRLDRSQAVEMDAADFKGMRKRFIKRVASAA